MKKYNPEIFELELLDKKKIVITEYNFGNIICYDINHNFLTNWTSGYYESPRLKSAGILIKPRWEKFKSVMTSDGFTNEGIK